MKRKKKGRFKFPVATLALAAGLVLFYFMVSGGSTYVTPLSRMYPLGVSYGNLVGSLTYTFSHIGVKHLLGNLVALLAFGAILEQRVDKWHVAGVFLISGVFAGFAYVLIHTDVWVIGASAAIAGLIAAGTVASTKKTLVALAAVLLLVPNVILPASDMALDALEGMRVEQAEEAQEKIVGLEERIEMGNYTPQTVEQKQKAEQQYSVATESKQALEEGRETEAVTPASLEIHLLGGLFAMMFMWAFDREVVKGFWRRFSAIVKS
ncbi:MAG: rhomboid family intramembrane serine protease [Candidatus Diapherotrites archaeon]|nr:rhomboid family intramembrane serine protease [Candidatus Diapherotrites archaeon]